MGLMRHAFLLVTFSLSRSFLTPSQCSGSAAMPRGWPVQALLHCCVYNRMSISAGLGKAWTVDASYAVVTRQ